MSIQDNKLETFIKKGGYDIVRQIKRGKSKGKFRGVSRASQVTGLARNTIYKILEEYPEKPSKVTPKYYDKLEETHAFRMLLQTFKGKIDDNHFKQTVRYMRICFRKLGYKAPETWDEDDWRQLWNDPEFYSEECKGIAKRIGVKLRRIMRVTDNHALLDKFKYNAPPQGKRKQWFMHTPEIKKLVRELQDPECLMLTFVGNAVGARHQALTDTKVKHIDFHDKTLQVFESKTQDLVIKYPPFCIFELLEEYIKERNLQPDDLLFPHGYQYHLDRLKKAGERARLPKKITTHILKHTFVTQARRHRVSAEVIVDMTGTELRTLEKYYTGKNEAKIRFEMQGIEYQAKPFHEWYTELAFFFRARYQEIKNQ